MLEVADIFRLHGPEYRAKFGDRMLPAHRRAMPDIEQDLSPALSRFLTSFAETGPGPALRRWAHRDARRAPDLDPRPALPSAHSLQKVRSVCPSGPPGLEKEVGR